MRGFAGSVAGQCIHDTPGRPVTAVPEGGILKFIDETRLAEAGTAGRTVANLAKPGRRTCAAGAAGDVGKADFFLNPTTRRLR